MTRVDTPDAFASAGAQRPGPLITLFSRGQYPFDRTGLQLGAYDSPKAAGPVLLEVSEFLPFALRFGSSKQSLARGMSKMLNGELVRGIQSVDDPSCSFT
jgi:hypothetical protein